MSGLDEFGFNIETLQKLKDDLGNEELVSINSKLNLATSSVFGQINGIVSAKLREQWELAEAAYANFYPDSASGIYLDYVQAFRGIVRNVGETDADYRIRAETELANLGTATLELLRAALLAVDDVTSAVVLENEEATVVGGLQPHSLQAIVLGGSTADITQAIFDNKAGGIETNGALSAAVVASDGVSHTMKFDRPTEVPIYMDIEINVLEGIYPVDGDSLVRTALKALGDTLVIGEDVIVSQFSAAISNVPGVNEVTLLEIEDVDPPTGTTNIVIDVDELATFDIADIDITATEIPEPP